MIRHFLVAALRNMAANRLQSVIAILSLSVGIAAAILSSLVIANQTSFDHFLPDYQRIYLVATESTLGGRPTDYFPYTPHDEAARLRQNFSEIEKVARVKDNTHSLRRGAIEAQETIYSADTNIFQILHLPVLYGRLEGALDRPDAIVIPRSIARKYFGRENVVGQTLELDRRHPLTVTAVVADLPANGTNLETAVFTSGAAADSDIARVDRNPVNGRNGGFGLDVETFVKLAPNVRPDMLQKRMLAMSDSLLPRPKIISANLRLIRLDAYHLSSDFSSGVGQRLAIFGVVACMILFLSVANFVNLSTARASRRGIEVGIRKSVGAGRAALTAQFLGESVLQSLFALCLALAMVEWSLPAINAFLNSGAVLDYWRAPELDLAVLAGAVMVGILAGVYPALIMSAFRSAAVLKGLISGSPRASLVRQSLVTLQFAVLVLLAIATGVMFEQHRFALQQTMRINTDQLLFVRLPNCEIGFKDEVGSLPGVAGVACSNIALIQEYNFALVKHPDGTSTALYLVAADPALLGLYGQYPIVGRGLSRTDLVNDDNFKSAARIDIVINETAVHKLGYASPQAALGQALHAQGIGGAVIIVGVIPDFSVFALEKQIDATAYYFRTRSKPTDELLNVRLKGRDIPETLAAIDAAWNRTGASGPIDLTFMNSYVQNLYLTLLREGQTALLFAGIAMVLGCLGLFGLSISATQRRTKEIGIRKALGATSGQVVGLLLWQFAKPVLWANVIAWPIAAWLMSRWLAGFAYHRALPLWVFPVAGGVTLSVALLTVAGQTILVARQKPVLALRYE